MGEHDHLISGPRCLGYALASGMTFKETLAELFGKVGGCAQGKGGIFGFFAPHRNFHGSYASAGAQTPVATGFAFALKYQQKPGVSICVLGDGATNQGAFHESLNLASLFNLPIVFIIENNQFSMYTSVPRHSAIKDSLAQRAEAYAMDWDIIEDGSDLLLVRERLAEAMDRARIHHRPTLVEIRTYRHYGFSVADPYAQKYRTPDEIRFFKEHHDPLVNWSRLLTDEGLLSPEKEREELQKITAELKEAIAFADTSPAPEVADLTRHVYWQLDHEPDSVNGRLIFD